MDFDQKEMERRIRGYFGACNRADRNGIVAFFTPDARHYFPAGSPFGLLDGAQAIAECWVRCVEELGSHWTVDNFVGDPSSGQAVIEWTHFKRKSGLILRGDEWYRLREDGLIFEIRAYYACPAHPGVAEHELGAFDYLSRGYPLNPGD